MFGEEHFIEKDVAVTEHAVPSTFIVVEHKKQKKKQRKRTKQKKKKKITHASGNTSTNANDNDQKKGNDNNPTPVNGPSRACTSCANCVILQEALAREKEGKDTLTRANDELSVRADDLTLAVKEKDTLIAQLRSENERLQNKVRGVDEGVGMHNSLRLSCAMCVDMCPCY